jgi:SAM-dependent methyltransferase
MCAIRGEWLKDYTYYNDRVNSATVERLLELNRQFYLQRGRDFAETRLRIQPGIKRIIETIKSEETILDLGCGNGTFARELSRAGHRGRYLGVDSSASLLEIAMNLSYGFPVDFLHADLIQLPGQLPVILKEPEPIAAGSPERRTPNSPPATGGWSMITAFAVLHHMPGKDLRVALLRRARKLLSSEGRLALSNWQFTSSSRLRERIRPWDSVGSVLDLDRGDYLLDWRRGQLAFRYVHEFDEPELLQLAAESGFVVTETFYSDGADHRSGLYQLWRPD